MKKILFVLLVFSLLVLAGCGSDEITGDVVKEIGEELICEDECSTETCSGNDYVACEDNEGCKKEINKGKVIDKCGVECLYNSDCETNEKCEKDMCIEEVVKYVCPDGETTVDDIINCPKPKEEPKKDTDSGSDFLDALEDLGEALEDSSRITTKINECIEVCCGIECDEIPAMWSEFYSACSQMYYYGGEKGLDDFIEGCRNG